MVRLVPLGTEYNPDACKQCAWHFYKTPQAIPEKYWSRLEFKKLANIDNPKKGAEKFNRYYIQTKCRKLGM